MQRILHRNRTNGFTLLEVLLALVIGGVVLAAARSLVENLADQAHRLALDAAMTDAQANGERVLRALAGELEAGTPESGPFRGDASSTQFTTWCDTPAGWLERCAVQVRFASVDSAPALVADVPWGGELVLRRGFQHGSLCYLASPVAGGQWVTRWGAGVQAPLAIGVVLDGDTMIVRIGSRG